MKQLDASLWKRKDYGIHTMFSLPHRCFYCHHAVLVWRGALHDNTKNSCEGDCTMFGYGGTNSLRFQLVYMYIVNVSATYPYFLVKPRVWTKKWVQSWNYYITLFNVNIQYNYLICFLKKYCRYNCSLPKLLEIILGVHY